MGTQIEWKCLGEEYLLIQGTQRRVVSSDHWWATLQGASPTQQELAKLWREGFLQQDVEVAERTVAWNLELSKEMRAYIADAESELEATRTEAEDGQVTQDEVKRQESLLEAAREQLQVVENELRQMMN